MPFPLALTLGEPAGIGPDITLAAWRRRVECALAPFYLLADPELIIRRSKQLAEDVPICVVEPAAAAAAFKHSLPVVDIGINVSAQPGRPDASSAPAALEAIRRAVADVTAGSARAIVTNPIAKNVLYRSGFTEPGHTEYLARLRHGNERRGGAAGDDAVVARARRRAGHDPLAAARGHSHAHA